MSGVKELSRGTGYPVEVIMAIFSEISKRIDDGEVVRIRGFGSFVVNEHKGFRMRTPVANNGKPLDLPDYKVVKFRMSSSLRDRVNTDK